MLASLFSLQQFLIVQMTLFGLKMLKIQLMILTMKGKVLIFETSIFKFIRNCSLGISILLILTHSILFFIYGYWRQVSRLNYCIIDYKEYTINILIRYYTLDQEMSPPKWITTILTNYLFCLLTIISAMLLSFKLIK